MDNLIQIAEREIGGAAVQTVDGRALHAFLKVGKDFTTWIKDRIKAYGFQDGQDFLAYLLPNFGEKGQGRPTQEYALSLDMAKELAMVERNDEGKRARLYFIECERRAKVAAVPALTREQQIAHALIAADQLIKEKDAQIAVLAPKADAHDRIADADGSLTVTEAAKALQIRPKDLFSYLRNNSWIYRRAGSQHDLGYQTRVMAGDLIHKVSTVLMPDGAEKIREQVRITPKGLTKLAKLIKPVATLLQSAA